ncbi:GNAT family N-acetyltransferase [Solitalea sp. MAHUQ-68]|uniref:GNAT family N-acetyltransferase n=1 Tax=Solitalea agri TaxID=2953739 RepID=A0A9X2F0M5_9SPHI|nr:GNAT family N-acetyltransferase [Solitalea agri]MCO4291934.1 GNAT family N-acetyltransferase [Solitalea agri]
MPKLRQATIADKQAIMKLYQRVAQKEGGIARIVAEITDNYISAFVKKAIEEGIILVVEHPDKPSELIGEIHCYRPKIKIFAHIMSDLTIVVDPDFQGKGIGRLLFTTLIEEVEENHSDILRIELFARESNTHAIKFYEKLGFTIEGQFENRVMGVKGLEADIAMAWFNNNYKGKYSLTNKLK